MQSKRDQAQAHTFMMGRLTSGMLLADPDAPESPLARTTRGVFIGCLVGALVAAGSLVYGLVSPGGNTSWKTSGALIVNRETGARYLYLDGRLRPVRNYASALLIGGGGLTVTDVGTASLRGTPVGTPVGVPGAPDAVPAAGDLDGGAWQVCSTTGRGGESAAVAVTTLVAGAPVTGHTVAADQGLVVSGPDKALYLVWQGSRLRLDRASGAAVSLGYGSVTPRPVSAAFLDALVAGPGLASPDVPGRGEAGATLGSVRGTVGQVYVVRVPGAAAQYYLLREEGLVPLTATGAALVLGDPATREKAYGGRAPAAVELGADLLRSRLAPADADSAASSAGMPASPPRVAAVGDDMAACARVQPGEKRTRITSVLVPRAVLSPLAQAAAGESEAACLPVDGTVVRPGSGALVRVLGAGGATVGDTTYLVAGDGVKYRVPDADALKALGYAQDDVVALPSPLLSMLPTGPDLDPAVATGDRAATRTAPDCGAGNGGSSGPPVRQASAEDHFGHSDQSA